MSQIFRQANARVAFAAFLVLYSACLIIASLHLSLWLDEVIQLIGTRDMPAGKLLHYIGHDPGQAPLGYFIQKACLFVFGFSKLSARLPSILFAVVACLVFTRLSKPGTLLFATIPMVMRYATEARPYAIALCLSVLAIYFFERWSTTQTVTSYIAFAACLMAGMYAQPYSIFIGAAVTIWLAIRNGPLRPSTLLAAAAVVIAGCAYLPWYLYSTSIWNHGGSGMPGTFGPKTAVMVLRELVGAGYVQSALVCLACACWLRTKTPRHMDRLFWLLLAAIPLLAPIAFDVHFEYFLASRQWIFSVPALAYMAGEAITLLRPRYACAALAVMLLAFITADVHWFTRPREDWAAAADVLASQKDACVAFIPPGARQYFAFFRPQLVTRTCQPVSTRAAVGVSPYGVKSSEDIPRGFQQTGILYGGQPKVVLYQAPPAK